MTSLFHIHFNSLSIIMQSLDAIQSDLPTASINGLQINKENPSVPNVNTLDTTNTNYVRRFVKRWPLLV
jgi:hypothetical protein